MRLLHVICSFLLVFSCVHALSLPVDVSIGETREVFIGGEGVEIQVQSIEFKSDPLFYSRISFNGDIERIDSSNRPTNGEITISDSVVGIKDGELAVVLLLKGTDHDVVGPLKIGESARIPDALFINTDVAPILPAASRPVILVTIDDVPATVSPSKAYFTDRFRIEYAGSSSSQASFIITLEEDLFSGPSVGSTLGSEDAPVTVKYITSVAGPYDQNWWNTVWPQLYDEYISVGKVRFEVEPVALSFYEFSERSGVAALCAGEQNRFFDFFDVLMGVGVEIDADSFLEIARALHLSIDEFELCLNALEIRSDSATPIIEINENPIIGVRPYEIYKQAIDGELISDVNEFSSFYVRDGMFYFSTPSHVTDVFVDGRMLSHVIDEGAVSYAYKAACVEGDVFEARSFQSEYVYKKTISDVDCDTDNTLSIRFFDGELRIATLGEVLDVRVDGESINHKKSYYSAQGNVMIYIPCMVGDWVEVDLKKDGVTQTLRASLAEFSCTHSNDVPIVLDATVDVPRNKQEVPVPEAPQQANQCTGCTLNGLCIEVGKRATVDFTEMYCSSSKSMNKLHQNRETCSFDYECASESCDGVCISESSGLFRLLLSLFGI